MGTGDLTHPKWLKELKEKLVKDSDTSLYRPAWDPALSVYYMITGEISTIFPFDEKTKKIHHLLLSPNLETAVQINDRLSKYGNLDSDGRPTLGMSAPQLVEEIMNVSRENVVIPAHVWTPWFSVFGAFSGFDRIEDCYQDTIKYISAIETGLSSDPSMNWRLSDLDRFSLVSNSDSHSPWPWRIGREANVFEIERLGYREIINAISDKDSGRFKYTIETDPAYGKYHHTGHRNCEISLTSKEAIRLGNRCPLCRKKLTKGVEQRVEELADRPSGFKPIDSPGFLRILPLSEIISSIIGVNNPGARTVWNIHNKLVSKFGNEYNVLLNKSKDEISEVVDVKIAEAILRVRDGRMKVVPGYDGVYGHLKLPVSESVTNEEENIEERKFGLERWM